MLVTSWSVVSEAAEAAVMGKCCADPVVFLQTAVGGCGKSANGRSTDAAANVDAPASTGGKPGAGGATSTGGIRGTGGTQDVCAGKGPNCHPYCNQFNQCDCPCEGGTGGAPGTGGAKTGGSGSGGSPASGGGQAGSATGGVGGAVDSGAGVVVDGGAGDSTFACGTELSCAGDQLCIQATWYPNNVNPDVYIPPSVTYSCKTNPCGTAPLSCNCGKSACAGYSSTCNAHGLRQLDCGFYATCASPETLIATPSGEHRIADLAPGDLVFSADQFALRAVPILRVSSTPVSHHRVVVSARLIDYAFSHIYDILPASNSGTYVAAGRLVGNTLK